MNRPYTAHSPYSSSPTERIPSHGDDGGETVDLDREPYDEYQGLEDDFEDYDDYQPIDRRWIWVAGVAGAILLVAVICTVVILGGGDSGSVSTTVAAPYHVTTGRDHVGAAGHDYAVGAAASGIAAAGNRYHRDPDGKRPAQHHAEPRRRLRRRLRLTRSPTG